MQAHTLAQRLRAKIQNPATPRPVRLAHNMVEKGQSRYLPILSSSLAQEILASGYGAPALERVYENRSRGGVVGRIADRMILDLPVHQGLRERLEAASGEIFCAAVMARRSGETDFRALFAPCGSAAEMLGAAARMARRSPEMLSGFRCWGVDADPDGSTLREAARQARAAGVNAEFINEDLRRRREVAAAAQREGGFHLVSCIGLSQQFSTADIARLIQFYAGRLLPVGTLLIDHWRRTDQPELAAGLGTAMSCTPAAEIHAALREAGLTIEREHPTGEGGCSLTVARKPR